MFVLSVEGLLDFEPVVARLFNVCDDAHKLGAAVQGLAELYLSPRLADVLL